MKPAALLFPLLAALAGLGACTSQVDDITVPDLTSPAALPVGVFVGRATFQTSATEVVGLAMIEPNGRMVVVGDGNEFLASGMYLTVGTGINAQLRFHVPNLRGADGLPVTPATTGDFIGTYLPQDSFTGTYVRNAGEAGSMNFVYDVQSATPADLSLLVGTWATPDAFGDSTVSFTFVNGGGFSGLDANGCRYVNAEAAIIDRRYNLYRVNFSRNCIGDVRDTVFTGLMTVLQRSSGGRSFRQMILTGSNGTAAVSFRLIGQS